MDRRIAAAAVFVALLAVSVLATRQEDLAKTAVQKDSDVLTNREAPSRSALQLFESPAGAPEPIARQLVGSKGVVASNAIRVQGRCLSSAARVAVPDCRVILMIHGRGHGGSVERREVALSDSLGRFSFEFSPDSTHEYSVAALGRWYDWTSRQLEMSHEKTVGERRDVQLGDLLLPKAADTSLKVTDRNGVAMENMNLRVVREVRKDQSRQGRTTVRVTTGPDGTAWLGPLVSGEWRSVAKPPYRILSRDVFEVRPEQDSLFLTVAVGETLLTDMLSGSVTSADGAGVSGVHICAASATKSYTAVSDAQGRFYIERPPGASEIVRELTWDDPSGEYACGSLPEIPNWGQDVRIALQESAVVNLNVIDVASGLPIKDVQVEAFPLRGMISSDRRLARTPWKGPNGFRVNRLAIGRNVLRVLPRDDRHVPSAPVFLDIKEGSQQDICIPLHERCVYVIDCVGPSLPHDSEACGRVEIGYVIGSARSGSLRRAESMQDPVWFTSQDVFLVIDSTAVRQGARLSGPPRSTESAVAARSTDGIGEWRNCDILANATGASIRIR